jgi:succinate dehydrogenase / fumarate reductase, membrane anchor subunit
MDTDSLRTDAAKIRHLGSARSGTGHLWRMRLTSLALVPLTIGFVWLLLSLLGKDYAQLRDALSAPCPALLLLLFIGAGVYHMQLGMQVIIEDYVHGEGARTLAIAANLLFCVALGVACIYAVLKLSLA